MIIRRQKDEMMHEPSHTDFQAANPQDADQDRIGLLLSQQHVCLKRGILPSEPGTHRSRQ